MTGFFTTGDPVADWKRRLRLDLFMIAGLYVVTMDRFTQNLVHEVFSLFFVVAMAAHLILNFAWYGSTAGKITGLKKTRGRINKPDLAFKFLVNAALLVTGLLAFVTGIAASQTVFAAWIPEYWRGAMEARTWHVWASIWFYVFAAMHAGMHSQMLLGAVMDKARDAMPRVFVGICWLVWAASVAIVICDWNFRQLYECFAGNAAYIYFERLEPVWLMPLDFICLFIAAAGLARLAIYGTAKLKR